MNRASYTIHNKVVSGRPNGLQLRNAVIEVLQSAPPDAILDLDFGPVETLDFSAADELVAGLVARVNSGELGSRRFCLLGLGEPVRESIDAVLELKKRVCLEIVPAGTPRVLGRISAPHRETLEYVLARGVVTAPEVAAHFWPEPNMTAATNRLNTLADSGLIVRRLSPGGPKGTRLVFESIVAARPE